MKHEAIRLHHNGLTKREIADKLGIGYSTVKNYTKGLNTKKSNTRYICRTCGTKGKENFYERAAYQCKSCWNSRTYKSAVDKIADYMESRGGAKCMKCGYDRCTAALEFHHRDPTEKDPTWRKGWSMERLKEELDKCDILCANCHREEHWLKRG